MNISVLELRSDFEGFESQEAAAGALVDWIRANAVPANADPRFVHILEQAMAPARDFVLPMVNVVDPDLSLLRPRPGERWHTGGPSGG